MKFWVVLLLLFMQSFCVVAQEQDKSQLEFLPRGIGRYKRQVNWQMKEYYSLRTLKKFKVGKKVCIHGTRFWDETCQDAAFAYAFGDSWREIKAASLRFVDLVNKGDSAAVAQMCIFPLEVDWAVHYHFDGTRYSTGNTFENKENFFIYGNLRETTLGYNQFIVKGLRNKERYLLALSENLSIKFDCYEDGDKNSQTFGTCLKYIPKIIHIH